MKFGEIENALGQRLASTCPQYKIAWPNRTFDPAQPGALPYLEFRHVPGERDDLSFDASYTFQTGIALVTVVTDRGNFSHQANTIAQSVADTFPYGLRMPVGDEVVLITKPSDFGTGFVDGVYFRQPVRIFYRTAPQV